MFHTGLFERRKFTQTPTQEISLEAQSTKWEDSIHSLPNNSILAVFQACEPQKLFFRTKN